MAELRERFFSLAQDREEWKAIPGYEGLYEVSSHGRVKSCLRTVISTSKGGNKYQKLVRERLLVPYVDKGKYSYQRLWVNLSREGVSKNRLIHQLVMCAFVGPCPERHEVAHNDGNPLNNHTSNLRYCLPAENTQDKYRHGTVLFGEDVHNAKLTQQDIFEIRRLKGQKTVYEISEIFSISIAQVSRIQNGKRWGHI